MTDARCRNVISRDLQLRLSFRALIDYVRHSDITSGTMRVYTRVRQGSIGKLGSFQPREAVWYLRCLSTGCYDGRIQYLSYDAYNASAAANFVFLFQPSHTFFSDTGREKQLVATSSTCSSSRLLRFVSSPSTTIVLE
jgi:hypothetical protein